jgi:S1-C subfamily serine protease
VAIAISLAAQVSAAAGDLPGLERSVVRIVNYAQRGQWYAPWNTTATRESSGSGFVVEGGRVMTNAHVVSDTRMCILYLHGDPTPHQARVAAIGHDCDLALLEPVEPGLLDPIPAMTFGGLPAIRSTVETYGYPAGGRRFSSTRGVVSRIELQRYAHSGLDAHLTVQTDAAINPGNSGGPVVQDGAVVGVAFQGTSHLENVGFFIPVEVVEHFLTDVEDGIYDGYPELGVMTSNLENPAARRAAGMTEDESGVSVFFVFPGSSAEGHVRTGDVLLQVQGHDVANDGTVAVDGLRFELGVLVDRLQLGEDLMLTVLRDGQRVKVVVPVQGYLPHKRYANTYDLLPRYYVYAGLVFVPLDREMLKTYGSRWASKANKPLLYEFFYRFFEEPERLTKEPVVLLRCLDHPVNANLAWRRNLLVERVNDQAIHGLGSLIEAFSSNADRYHVIEFAHGGRFDVLDREEADRAHSKILRLYGVSKDRRL